MPTVVHRFYDLFSGGGEVTILNMVLALPEWTHVLAFDRAKDTWLSDALQRAGNVRFEQTSQRDFPGLVDRLSPDVVVAHWYPPMSVSDLIDLPPSVLERTVLYNQWYRPIPFLSGLKRVCFVTPWLERTYGRDYPPESRRVVINPVLDHFFDVQVLQDGPPSVGRHARPVDLKVSADFFQLYEGIPVDDLQVRVMGWPDAVLDARLAARDRLQKSYWLLPFNSMDVADFLRWVQVYVYRTNPVFTEACGISVGEAMAAGIPPVVDARGGLTSLVQHGKTGFLCTDLPEYQQAAAMLLQDRDRRLEMGAAARQWARENLHREVFRERLLDLFS